MRNSSEVRIFDSSMLFTLSNSPGAPSISEHLGSKFGGDNDAGEKRGKSSCLKEKFNIAVVLTDFCNSQNNNFINPTEFVMLTFI